MEISCIQTNVLTEEQIQKVRELETICQEHEGLKRPVFLSGELNLDPRADCFYLSYEGDRLIAFLSLFMILEGEAEVSAYTLPEFRQRGAFTLLFQKAVKTLAKQGIHRVLFVHEPLGADAKRVLETLAAIPSHSEYLLVFDRAKFRKPAGILRLETPREEDIPRLAALDSELFGNRPEESVSIMKKALESPTMKVYFAFLGNEPIGLCNISTENGNSSIFGLGIVPKYQGKGYGRETLSLLLERLMPRDGKITLEVAGTNRAACQLYRTSGFDTETQYDYALLTLPSK